MRILRGLFKIENRMDTRSILRVALMAFVMLSLLGCIPYLASGAAANFADALFESVSGFTTTGAVAISSWDTLPMWLKLYRAFTEWVGGAAVVVFFASTLKSFDADSSFGRSGNSAQLYRSGIRFANIVSRLLITYAAGTVLCFFSLLACGMKAANALLYSFSTISTGGFTADTGIDTALQGSTQTVVLVFMMLCCINFTMYYHAIKKHFSKIINNSEFFAYICILFGACVIVVASLYFSKTYDFTDSVHFGIFQTISSGSTTGFVIADTNGWPSLSKIVLMLMSFIGGCSASVGSGIKVMRILILAKIIACSFVSRIHPAAVTAVKMNGKRVSNSINNAVFAHFMTCLAFFFGGMFVLSFEAPSLEEALVLTAGLINNVGGSLAGYSAVMKLFMCVVMLAGRLEFYALLLPFTKKDSIH